MSSEDQAHKIEQVLSFTFEACYSAIRAINDGDAQKAKRLLNMIMQPLAFQTIRYTNASLGSPFMNKLTAYITEPTAMDDPKLD